LEIQDRDPCKCKSGHDPPRAEIFYENAGWQQNTVNAGFPARWIGENACRTRHSRKIGNSTNGGAGTGAGALPL
jgi:hypothetical protein